MSSQCKFQGPAGSKFPTFLLQALSSLNNCCPRWNDQKDPKSYMIPPIFYFKHPEMPDHEIEELRQTGKFDRDVIDRTSDDAEHMVFDAFNILVGKGFAAPFVALRDFNLNRIGAHLGKIFPRLPSSVTSKTFGEYDYVLIGPNIGIIVIEVKSTSFTGKRDFNSNLPEQYQKGIEQLRSFDDTVLNLLEQVTGISMDRGHVRRILFTPNFKRTRYDKWFSRMDASRQICEEERVKGIDRWFWEDTQPASQLCDSLRSYLVQTTHCLPSAVFELYVPILAGLSSVTITKERVSIDSETLSERQAVLRVSGSIEAQDPWSLDPSPKRQKVERPIQTVELLKSIILTPEQSAALRGPSNQFIVGAAGTGKTIILQARALELLRKEESVLVFCSDLYIGHYVDLFERHKLKGFAVKSWTKFKDSFEKNAVLLRFLRFTKRPELLDAASNFISETLTDPKKRSLLTDYFKELVGYKHVLIDDIFADGEPKFFPESAKFFPSEPLALLYPMFMMAYAKVHPSFWKTLWVAADPFADPICSDPVFSILSEPLAWSSTHFLYGFFKNRAAFFTISDLTTIMRCPENVFSHLPVREMKSLPMPVIGHNIQGSRSCKILTTCDAVSTEIIDLFENGKANYPLDQIAVIVGQCVSAWVQGVLIKNLNKRNVSCTYNSRRSAKQSDKYDSIPSGKSLGIYAWDDVHSLEWSLVIYIRKQREGYEIFESHPHYLVCSRATAMLVEIVLDRIPNLC